MRRIIPIIILMFAGLILTLNISCGKQKEHTNAPASKTEAKKPAPADDTASVDEKPVDKDIGKAKALLNDMANNPNDEQLRLDAGRAAYNAKMYDEALKTLAPLAEGKVGGQPEALAWQYMAQSAMESGNKEEAVKLFSRIRQRYADDPDNLRAMVMHEGNIYWKNGHFDQALTVFNELIKLGDKDQEPGVVLQIAMVYWDAGKRDQSAKTLQKIISGYPGQKTIVNEARLRLATYYVEKGELEKGRKLAFEADKKGADKNSVSGVLRLIGSKYADKEGYEKVVAYYESLLDMFKKSDKIVNDIRCDLGNYYLKNGEKEKAVEVLKLVADKSPDDTQKQWAFESITEISKAIKESK